MHFKLIYTNFITKPNIFTYLNFCPVSYDHEVWPHKVMGASILANEGSVIYRHTVLEREINLQSCHRIYKLDNWDSCSSNSTNLKIRGKNSLRYILWLHLHSIPYLDFFVQISANISEWTLEGQFYEHLSPAEIFEFLLLSTTSNHWLCNPSHLQGGKWSITNTNSYKTQVIKICK